MKVLSAGLCTVFGNGHSKVFKIQCFCSLCSKCLGCNIDYDIHTWRISSVTKVTIQKSKKFSATED